MSNRNNPIRQNPDYQTVYEHTVRGGAAPGWQLFKSDQRNKAEKQAHIDGLQDRTNAKLDEIRREAKKKAKKK